MPVKPEMFEYFEMQGDSFVILDVDKFKERTRALAINATAEGIFVLDEDTLEWKMFPFEEKKKKTAHLHPIK